MRNKLSLIIFYFGAFLQGSCLVILPVAFSFFSLSRENAISKEQFGWFTIPLIVGVLLISLSKSFFFKNYFIQLGFKKQYYIGLMFNFLYLLITSLTYFSIGENKISIFLFYTAQFFLGLGFGLFLGVLNSNVISLFPNKSYTVLTGLHASLGIGSAIAPILVSYSGEEKNWQLSAIVIQVLFIFLILVSKNLIFTKEVLSKNVNKKLSFPVGAQFYLFIILVYGIIESIVAYWTTDYLVSVKKLNSSDGAFAISLFWFFATGGRILASFLVLVIPANILFLASPIFVSLVIIAIISVTFSANILLFLFILLGLSMSWFFPFSINISLDKFKSHSETISSLALAGLMAGYGIGPPLISILLSSNVIEISDSFKIALGMSILLFILTLFANLVVKPEEKNFA